MQLIRGLHNWQRPESGCVATIGNFDGVHKGHQAIFAQLKAIADKYRLPSVVISFQPLPHELFKPDAKNLRLQTLGDRIECIAHCKIGHLLVLQFNHRFASQDAGTFITDTLMKTLNIKHLLIGDDFRFGAGRTGDIALLKQHEQPNQFSVSSSATIEIDGARVSSTRIRDLLQQGECQQAATLLGRWHRITGKVVKGEQIGRQLGFPTANVALKDHRPLLRGVFAVEALRMEEGKTGQLYPAVANLGERPTVGGRKLLLEVHLLDQSLDLYNERLAIDFHHFIRGEQKFDSLDHLKEAINADADVARQYFSAR